MEILSASPTNSQTVPTTSENQITMPPSKRCLLWDWTCTQRFPDSIENVRYDGPISSISNWNTWVPPELKNRLPFRPTIRTEAQLDGDDWKNVKSSDQPIIHFFNEPERAGISPHRAANLWKEKMVVLRAEKGPQLVSPSCASDAAGEAWLAHYMNHTRDTPPDFLGLHYYGDEAKEAIRYIETMHMKYPFLPVVVSEIACTSREGRKVLEFTAKLCNWMDETSWIFEYAFFGCMPEVADDFVSPQAQLMNKDGTFRDLMYKLMNDQPIRY